MKRGFVAILFVGLLQGCSSRAYLFTSFQEPADQGLRMLYSFDGLHWKDADTVLFKPEVGLQQVMRDPSMVLGPDGIFHLVWTTSWRGDKGFGYASSRDLLQWSKQTFIPVMDHEPSTVNVWAPELYYDDISRQYLVIWASCIPGRFERGIEEDSNNHRMYVTSTSDFKSFSPTRLFLDPGFSVIDAVIVKKGMEDYILVLKDNTRPERNIRVASASSPQGPWKNISKPFSDKLTEGPTVLKKGSDWLIYYDSYGKKEYEAVRTKDFVHFENINQEVSLPPGHKHGTIVPVKKAKLKKFLNAINK